MKQLDIGSAVTRSMLGWGVLAGPIYLAVGLALALTRDGFELGEHALSLLMLGDGGWMQRADLAVNGLLCLLAAIGVRQAMVPAGGGAGAGRLLGLYSLGLFGGAAFAPDPVDSFPAGAHAHVTASGLLHLAFGLVQFVSVAIGALSLSRWAAARDDRASARGFRAAAVVILGGFIGGAALAQSAGGVALLWVAVLASYGWLAAACLYLWPIVPHPDLGRRHLALTT
ncbi:DUF998 domain-containing protein [Phytohabitans houttuyneae]|uniref:DUF998 domain-containing protein n=1 Tax=Phytohabitans houttuyneae TaxID=1076126 RepID=A0A6V8KIC9_9ACTN|nr:DUF998 domain-containing protein [Phytohabitans houttuyneae]GFJ83594.1 hypothetical protein Phou_077740 [Phytohabitans houttuyneae]